MYEENLNWEVNSTSLTNKGMAAIPSDIRSFLDSPEVDNMTLIDLPYIKALQNTLLTEWNSKRDCEAYDNLM